MPFRWALELIRDGTLGEIREVHVWNSAGGANRQQPPKGEEPVPEYFQWDLWLGPAAFRPYHHEWLQRNLWRELGTCQLGNWASHTMNLALTGTWTRKTSADSRRATAVRASSRTIRTARRHCWTPTVMWMSRTRTCSEAA